MSRMSEAGTDRNGRTSGPLPPRAAGALVFLAAAAVLVLEIAAIRLIAPYVGVTLETNTAVIGTALAAIAFGAWTGGQVADRIDPARLLGPVLVGGGALTMLTLPAVRWVGAATQGTPGVSVVLLIAMVAVFPPAALLSAVTPMVIKLQLTHLGRTGTVVGRLSGIGTLGAITATFLTGFVLLAAFSTSVILLGTGCLMILTGLAGAWQRRRDIPLARPGAVAVLPLVPLLVVLAPAPCDVETAYHCARVQADPARPAGRVLWLDSLQHSYVDLDDPRYLQFAYIRALASVADVMRSPGSPVAALHVGGGGFTMPRYLAATRPGSREKVLEIDKGVVDLGRERLGVSGIPNLTVRIGDARVGLAGEPAATYDLVIGDAFGGIAVPWHLTTRQTVEQVGRVLRGDGIYAVNVIDWPPDRFARAELATLRSVFGQVAVAASAATLAGFEGGNHVLLASREPLPLDRIEAALLQREPTWRILDPAATAAFAGAAQILTDDHAPVDQLITVR
jgi:spermidine synthase